jgi:predicted RNase H-like HicB family nuclease
MEDVIGSHVGGLKSKECVSMEKDIEYYMSLPYTVDYRHVTDDPNYPEGYYYGGIVELEGCKIDGETVGEFLAELEIVKRDYLEIKLEFGDPIPEP